MSTQNNITTFRTIYNIYKKTPKSAKTYYTMYQTFCNLTDCEEDMLENIPTNKNLIKDIVDYFFTQAKKVLIAQGALPVDYYSVDDGEYDSIGSEDTWSESESENNEDKAFIASSDSEQEQEQEQKFELELESVSDSDLENEKSESELKEDLLSEEEEEES